MFTRIRASSASATVEATLAGRCANCGEISQEGVVKANYVPDLIFDVGAHTGEDSDFYLKLGYRVLAIEANPLLAHNLRNRFSKEISDGQYILLEKAVGAAEGNISFYINETKSVWGTANSEWAERNRKLGAFSKEITVQSIRFNDIISTYGCPYYLKIDIEGSDMLCINALSFLDCRPKHISLESTKTSWSDLSSEFDALERLGYKYFKVVKQGSHKSSAFKNRYGQHMTYAFDSDATGPFGDYLEGVWLSKDQAIRKYFLIFIGYTIMGDNTFLSTVVGEIPLVRRILHYVGWYDTHAMYE